MNANSSNRRLPLILVAGVLVLCLVGVILAGVSAGSGFGAVAYTVNDTKVSQQSVNDDLQALAEQENFAKNFLSPGFQTTPGAVDASGAAAWITLEIYRQVGAQVLEQRGKTVTEQQRQDALDAQVTEQGPSFALAFEKLPRHLRNRLLDVLVTGVKAEVLRRTHISVDPKYGFWNAKRQIVCPPTGCPSPTG